MSDQPQLAILGLGIMGGAMAARLADAGFSLRVWNRTRAKAAPVEAKGATVCETPAEAVAGAEVVLTVLSDGPATEQAVLGSGALKAMAAGTTWIQMGTVGVAWTGRFAAAAEDARVVFVDAPVLGTKAPAERGELLVLASGPEGAQATCAPIFEGVGKRVRWLGAAGEGSRLKLVINGWLVGLLAALADTLAFAEATGVDPEVFLEAIDGGALNAPYAQLKGRMMVARNFETSFPLRLALKDARLVLEAAGRAGLSAETTAAVARLFERAEAAGAGDADMSAIFLAARGEAPA